MCIVSFYVMRLRSNRLTLDSGGRSTEAEGFDTGIMLVCIMKWGSSDLHVRVQSSLQEPLDLAAVGSVLCFLLDLEILSARKQVVQQMLTYSDGLLLKQINDFLTLVPQPKSVMICSNTHR